MWRHPMFQWNIGTILTRKRVWRIGLYSLGCLTIICISAVVVGAYYFSATTSSEEIVSVTIVPGSTTTSIAKHLATNELIRSPLAFKLAVRYRGIGTQLRAGKYELNRNMSLTRILDELKNGQIEYQTFTVPEGFTAKAIAELWEESKFGTAKAFQDAIKLPELLEKYVPEGVTAEGYLFPETYKFAKGSSVETVVQMMLVESLNRWTDTLAEEAKALDLTRHQVITLASIIQREAGSTSEIPRIAGVFHNRLEDNWRLQADPTVLYAIGDPKRLLTREDLKVESPYNTYLHKGLPPGPIGNPGMAAILGALRPEETTYYYFVAIEKGKHHFSETLAEHNRIIRQIRRKKSTTK